MIYEVETLFLPPPFLFFPTRILDAPGGESKIVRTLASVALPNYLLLVQRSCMQLRQQH
jgi:hypothetical protein